MFSDFKNSFYRLSILNKCDFIGNTTNLKINGEKHFKTKLGGLLSIAICFLTILAGFYFCQEVWKKAKPNVNRSIISTPSPEDLVFGENWEFFFGLQYNNVLYRDDSIYTIKGRLFKFIEGIGLTMQEYKIEPCTIDSFHERNKNDFLQYNINGTWCLSKDNIPDLKLSNVWGKPGFSFMDISLWPCRNTTTSSICKPKEEIEKRLNIGVFSIYTMYSIILTTDYKSPFKTAIYNDFLPVSYKSFTHSILYLYHSQISSDVGFLLEDIQDVNSHGIDRLKINFYTQPELDTRFMRFQFQLTNWKEKYNRNYIKLQDIAAQIGGIINVFYIGSLILNFFISDFLYKQYIVDRFYGFNEVVNEYFVKKNTLNLDNFNEKNDNDNCNSNINNSKSKIERKKISHDDYFDSENSINNVNLNESNSNRAQKNLLNDSNDQNILDSKELKKNSGNNLDMSFKPLKNNFLGKTMNLKFKNMNSKIYINDKDKLNRSAEEINKNKLQSESANKLVKTEDLVKELSKIYNKSYVNLELPLDINLIKNDNFTKDILTSLGASICCLSNEENTIKRIHAHYNEIENYTSLENIIELSHNMKILKRIFLTEYEAFLFESFSGKLCVNSNFNINDFNNMKEFNNLKIEFTPEMLNAKFKKDEGLLFEEKNSHNSLVQILKCIK